ncbi:MAG TPA: prenyltransferase/squalene oxidase repeat-containing protein [Bryobacteraceae bacterium]|nr:prenyltransferase/squalene oxidase repeat-containing protein [Bryobacteraceae bacterium]
MNANGMRVLAAGVAVMAIGIYAQRGFSGSTILPKNDMGAIAVEKGAHWLVSVQGQDGGWGQDGGETSYVRQGEHLESNGNDVANTAVAATALLHAGTTAVTGPYHVALQRAVNFILRHVEQSPAEGLTVTDLNGTQIQRKLGPFIDTFLTSKLLAELDGNMGDARLNARVRQSLQKCVAKIEKNQMQDGSWNVAGGWAPILGTSMASRSLFMAQQKGVAVSQMAMAKVDEYTQRGTQAPSTPRAGGRGMEATVITGPVAGAVMVDAASAGVPLYKSAQTLEQLSRTDADRKKNAREIRAITNELENARFVSGFGSIGGEEFFSYLNISDGLHRAGGAAWEKWNGDMKTKVIRLQNEDGTWSGQHCITGRVAVTSAAILLLVADRDPLLIPAGARKN